MMQNCMVNNCVCRCSIHECGLVWSRCL